MDPTLPPSSPIPSFSESASLYLCVVFHINSKLFFVALEFLHYLVPTYFSHLNSHHHIKNRTNSRQAGFYPVNSCPAINKATLQKYMLYEQSTECKPVPWGQCFL